jgi:hypothetical protein
MSQRRIKISEQIEESAKAEQAQENEQASLTPASEVATTELNTRQNAVLNMQRTAGNAAVMRALAQRKGGSYGAEGGEIDDQTTSRINSARGSGQSLPTATAQRMGESMGADFSDVRVHTDSQSHELNQTLNARAFTTGSDIFFQQGEYQPGTSGGDKLLAHELTHVVQQGGSSTSGPLTLGPASDSYESEADSVSDSVTGAAQRTPLDEDEMQPN